MVFNNTRVIPARVRGRKTTGGAVEILFLSLSPSGEGEALVKGGTPQAQILLPDRTRLRLLERRGRGRWLLESRPPLTAERLDAIGEVPLPPYILRRRAELGSARTQPEDRVRYQTVYAAVPGSVAAPTAGLHFTKSLLERLHQGGISTAFLTLHIGIGTFQPFTPKQFRCGTLHSEEYLIPPGTVEAVERAHRSGGRVIAVGTSTTRALEAAAAGGALAAGRGTTELFIRPGFRFKVVNGIVTNFHLPGSSLFILVSAFAGADRMRGAYAEACRQGYRFLSYGDGMVIR